FLDFTLDGLPGALQDVAPATGKGPSPVVGDLTDQQYPTGGVEDTATHVEFGCGVTGGGGHAAPIARKVLRSHLLHQFASQLTDAVEPFDVELVGAIGQGRLRVCGEFHGDASELLGGARGR